MIIKPKLLYVVEAMGGGVFTYIVDLTSELLAEYDIYIAYAVRPQTPSDYKEYFDKRIHLFEVKDFGREINAKKDFKAAVEINAIVKAIKPDIIHLHSSKAGVIGRIIFNGKDVPLFYTPHGYSFLMQNCRLFKRAIFRTIEMIFAKRNCTTISCSLGEHQETLKFTNNAVCVNNGINIRQLQTVIDNTEKRNHEFTVFTLGRICSQKNPKLFNEIAEAMPNARFLWIGDGELREELIAANIVVTGWVDRKKALQYAVNADVFLLTSLWEGLPISLLEAMYMGKLCIVNDVIGNNDVIEDGKNGFICRNVAEFVEAIRSERELGIQARVDIERKYSTVVMAHKYCEIYRSKLRKKL